MSLADKINAWAKSPQGQAKIQSCLEDYAKRGITKTNAGTGLASRDTLENAGEKMCSCLIATARDYNLPASVMAHIEEAFPTDPELTKDGYVINILLDADMHRKSLYDDEYDGVDNIVALFNNGYEASATVYGWWDGHGATSPDVSVRSFGANGSVWVPSKRSRPALHFIQEAINDYLGNFGAQYGVISVKEADIYKG